MAPKTTDVNAVLINIRAEHVFQIGEKINAKKIMEKIPIFRCPYTSISINHMQAEGVS